MFQTFIEGGDKVKKKYKPGEKPPDSGQYVEKGPRGGKVSNTEITAIENKPLPPTSKPGNVWVLVDKTKHKKR
jgi:hypothetical protein